MLTASLGILAALAFVLGLIAIAVWAMKRLGAGGLGARNRLPVEVVQRLPLGPKSGLAVVRVGEKVMVVSMGDGGVHPLFELDEADRQRVLAGSEIALPMESSLRASQTFGRAGTLPGWQRVFGGAPSPRPTAAPAPTVAPFQQSLASALQATEPAALDLRSVLSMTLAPSTRLLGLAAFLVASAMAPSHALVAQPAVPTAPAVEAAATAAPTAAQPAVTAQTGAQPTATAAPPAATPRTGAQGAAARRAGAAPAVADVEPAQPAPVSASEALSGLVPQLDLRVGNGENSELRLNGTVGVVLMMGLMTLIPTLLLMMTGFTRILIVLHFLKQAMGTQSAPPAHLVAGLALLLTGFVMAPTITEANRTAIAPWLAGEIQQTEMLKIGVQPFRAFMLRQTNEKDLRTFVELSRMEQPNTPDDVPLHVLMAAFVASELRTAFQIGFAIYLPFIVIDAVVASVLMAMGMFMLPPAMISLPFKLLLFVLVDGWSLTIQSLVQSFR
jgi:flagellar biosynthesis protein FliP